MTTDTGYILVTGSRDCPKWLMSEIGEQLKALARQARAERGVRRIEVVHGDADGVDKTAKFWTMRYRPTEISHKPFQADWEADCDPERCAPDHRRPRKGGGDFCPAQGIYRNGRMVDYIAQQYHEHGAWVKVAAFYKTPYSRGTANCVLQARTAGFDVLEFGNVPEAESEESG